MIRPRRGTVSGVRAFLRALCAAAASGLRRFLSPSLGLIAVWPSRLLRRLGAHRLNCVRGHRHGSFGRAIPRRVRIAEFRARTSGSSQFDSEWQVAAEVRAGVGNAANSRFVRSVAEPNE